MRSVAFMSGGYVPMSVRGTSHHGLISVCDWYQTFCFLAGCDAADVPTNTSVPVTDSINVWPSLLVPNNTRSPRTEIFLSYAINDHGATDAGLIIGTKKIVCGHQANQGFWQSEVYPNASSASMDPPYERYPQPNDTWAGFGCVAPNCCLFDIFEVGVHMTILFEHEQSNLPVWPVTPDRHARHFVQDESELKDLRTTQPAAFGAMMQALTKRAKTVYQTAWAEPNTPACLTDAQARSFYRGFIGAHPEMSPCVGCRYSRVRASHAG